MGVYKKTTDPWKWLLMSKEDTNLEDETLSIYYYIPIYPAVGGLWEYHWPMAMGVVKGD